MEQHAGKIIELAVRSQHANISELSKRLKVNRRTIYNWFRQKKLHIDVILKIGQAINYDFSRDFQSMPEDFGPGDGRKSQIKGNNSDVTNTVYYWMEKYIALLDDYKNLVHKIESQNMLT